MESTEPERALKQTSKRYRALGLLVAAALVFGQVGGFVNAQYAGVGYGIMISFALWRLDTEYVDYPSTPE